MDRDDGFHGSCRVVCMEFVEKRDWSQGLGEMNWDTGDWVSVEKVGFSYTNMSESKRGQYMR
jgi:hypothetical protein